MASLACQASYSPAPTAGVVGCGTCGRSDVVATPGPSGALVVEPHRPGPVPAERHQRAERALLLLAVDPGYVDPDYGRHTAECWAEAHPLGECWCPTEGVPDGGAVSLATFAAAVGGAA